LDLVEKLLDDMEKKPLDDMEKAHPTIRRVTLHLRQELLGRQGDAQIWASGEKAYFGRKWAEAIEAFSKITDQQYYELAQERIKRARAASEAELGQQELENGNYTSARALVQSAQKTFSKVDTDDATQVIFNQLDSLLKKIEIEEDRFAQQEAKNQASQELAGQLNLLLDEAGQFIQHVLDVQKNAPVSELVNLDFDFQEFLSRLKSQPAADWQQKKSLSDMSRQVRASWRSFNRAMMQAVSSSRDVTILRLAFVQAEAAQLAGLFENEDESLYATLQSKKLDRELEEFFLPGGRILRQGISWQDVEKNRSLRLQAEKYRFYDVNDEAQVKEHQQ
ncbi:MAG: hypothetical protein AB1403_26770, partial [Candidatus Riflebacteria bacterium]